MICTMISWCLETWQIALVQQKENSKRCFLKNRITIIQLQWIFFSNINAMCRCWCLIVHVGDFSENRDGSLIRASTIEEALEKEELHILLPTSLPLDDSGETFSHYLAADEAFPLIKLMRLYLRRMLTNKRFILNCTLSRAQKSVEYAFGLLNAKFKISEGPICHKEEDSVVKEFVLLLKLKEVKDVKTRK